MSTESGARSPEVEELAVDECWRLLGLGSLGRLAVVGPHGEPDLVPINYLAHERALFFRTSPGAKLRNIDQQPEVAFEIDGQDDVSRWSVVVRGTARVLTARSEIDAAGITRLISSSPAYKDTYVCVTPEVVSGRRFRKRRRADAVTGDGPRLWAERDGVLPKPSPIPHRPPLHD